MTSDQYPNTTIVSEGSTQVLPSLFVRKGPASLLYRHPVIAYSGVCADAYQAAVAHGISHRIIAHGYCIKSLVGYEVVPILPQKREVQ